jgi:hypothetical protein
MYLNFYISLMTILIKNEVTNEFIENEVTDDQKTAFIFIQQISIKLKQIRSTTKINNYPNEIFAIIKNTGIELKMEKSFICLEKIEPNTIIEIQILMQLHNNLSFFYNYLLQNPSASNAAIFQAFAVLRAQITQLENKLKVLVF